MHGRQRQEARVDHSWVGAATVGLTDKQAAHADLRGSVRVPVETRVDVLEVYCGRCRRPYDDVADEPCIAAAENGHLIGGPIAERRNRTHTHDCKAHQCAGSGVPPTTVAQVTAAYTGQMPAPAEPAPAPAAPAAAPRRASRPRRQLACEGQLILPIAV
jgi:hypothetical protein